MTWYIMIFLIKDILCLMYNNEKKKKKKIT